MSELRIAQVLLGLVAVAQIIFLIAHVDATKLHAAVTPVIW